MRIRRIAVGEIMTNCFIISADETEHAGAPEGVNPCVLVDPGDEAERIARLLDADGLRPSMILLTHGHFDHIGAADALRRKYGAEIVAGEQERGILGDFDKNLSRPFTGIPITLEADRYVSETDIVSAELGNGESFAALVIETPGHTIGGVSYYLREDGILFSGDTLFRSSVGRSDFPTGDEEVLHAVIREKLMGLPDEVAVLPGHGQTTTIGAERRYF